MNTDEKQDRHAKQGSTETTLEIEEEPVTRRDILAPRHDHHTRDNDDKNVGGNGSGGGNGDDGDDRLSDCDALTAAGDDPEANGNGGGGRGRALSILSRLSSRGPLDLGPAPDGGFAAWSTCVGTHIVFANTWGFINSFGVFQTYYADFLAPLPPSTISWIGSVQVFLTFFLSAITGRIGDAGYFWPCYWTGFAFMLLGVFTASVGARYWQLMLSQGLSVGLAAGFLCCPSMSNMVTYFDRRRALAIGVLSCGNVTGGLIYPAIARQLLPAVGFHWTLRAVGFLQLGLLLVAALLIRVRRRPKLPLRPIFDFAVFKDLEYTMYGLGMIFNMAGTFIIYYYIASFGRGAVTPAFSYPQSLNLLLIFNGIGIVGRLSVCYYADHVGPLNLVYPMALLSALLCFALVAVRNPSGLYGWVSVYGVIAGALQALFPAGLSSLTTDMSKVGQRIGLGFTFIGVSVVAGPPVAGAMITAMHGRYWGAQLFAACLLVVGGSLVMVAKVLRMRRTNGRWGDKI
ncbi:major facilitator superfamily transporter [Niveomyces insectorum RCEF 264]|uniref:Major facilitator superfamily transporter n=1 Tax=Niveomyces insectorum RCEF 264 TaxID=1081102 RepID=A0A162MNW6_9HYPO|nr:major facilitator superfamily transporter [Niveomyces insectorum RCEF 264]